MTQTDENDALIEHLRNELGELEELHDECRRMLRDWRATSPQESDASPDAVLAIAALKDSLRKEMANLRNRIGETQLPF